MPKIAASQREQYIKDKRNQILDAAIIVFGKKGVTGANVAEIAETAGIAKGTIYLYFPSKDDIFSAIVNERAFVAQLADILNDTAESVESTLVSVADKYYYFAYQYLPVLRMAIAETNRFPNHVQKVYQDVIQKGVEILAVYLKRLSDNGKIRSLESPSLTARAFMGLLSSYIITQELLGGEQVFPVERGLWVKESVHLFMEGIK